MTTAARARDIVLRGELVNNVAPAGADLTKRGVGKHLQPGLVKYEAVLNPDGSVQTPEITYLLELDGIEAMRPTAAGIPVVGKSEGFDHTKVQPGKEYDGLVTDSFWDGESGWEAFNFEKMNAETAQACANGFQFSCAYVPTQVDETPGKWHGLEYDAKILNGRYTHVAVVPVPRYDGAEIELLNSGGQVNDTIKNLIKGLLPAKALRELANAAEEDEKKAKKDKAKADFENAMKNAADEPAKAKAKTEYDNAMAAADKPGAADDAEKKNAELKAQRANKVAALRNAAKAVEEATGDKEKGMPFMNEADALEKLPLGGGDVVPDPGVVPAGGVPVDTTTGAGTAVKEESATTAAGGGADGAAMATADEKAAMAAEQKNMAEAWNSFASPMVNEGVAAKVLITVADKKILPLDKQPEDVRAAWRDAYRGAAGATVVERCNSLKARGEKEVELRNARKAQLVEAAKREVERETRFRELENAAAARGGFGPDLPLLGESTSDKAALGEALYG